MQHRTAQMMLRSNGDTTGDIAGGATGDIHLLIMQ